MAIHPNAQIDGETGALTEAMLPPLAFPMGDIFVEDNSIPTFLGAGYTPVLGVTQLGVDLSFDQPQAGQLRYTGKGSRHFHAGASLSFTGGGQPVRFKLRKSGAGEIHGSLVEGRAPGQSVESTAVHVMVELAENDYLELVASGSGNLTVLHYNLFAMSTPCRC